MRQMSLLSHHAMSPSIEEIDYQPDRQPDDQPVPVFFRQGEHQQQAGQDPENWNQRNQRSAEWAIRIRIGPAHYQHGAEDDYKGEGFSDPRLFGQDPRWKKPRHSRHEDPGKNR